MSCDQDFSESIDLGSGVKISEIVLNFLRFLSLDTRLNKKVLPTRTSLPFEANGLSFRITSILLLRKCYLAHCLISLLFETNSALGTRSGSESSFCDHPLPLFRREHGKLPLLWLREVVSLGVLVVGVVCLHFSQNSYAVDVLSE